MEVTVVCFGAMRDHLPPGARGNRARVTVPSGATAADVMDALGAPRRLAHAILIDGARATLGTELTPGAEVTLMPPFAGGSIPVSQ